VSLPEILYDLDVKHSETSPLFVLGHGRSGTSILIKMIRKYLKVNFGTESQFIIRFYNKLPQYGDLNNPENARQLIADISRERWFRRINKRFGFVFDKERALENLKQKSYSGILQAIFEQFADYHEMVRWGDKTPEYIYDLPVLNKLFPGAKYIHIVRDGRDVTLSEFETPFGAKNVYRAADDWFKKLNMIRDFGYSLSQGRFLEIRYEDLLSRPIDVFAEMIRFLDIDDRDGELHGFIRRHIGNDLRNGNFFKWKNRFSQRQLRMFERVAGSLLTSYHYPVFYENPRPVGGPEKLYWNIDNFVKRKFKVRYWQDNLYRLSLRFKDIVLRVRRNRSQINTLFPKGSHLSSPPR